MKTRFFLILAIITLQDSVCFAAEKLDNEFFIKATAFFKEYVNDDLVVYNKLRNNSELQKLITAVENIDLTESSPDEKKAFYINAYNLIVIHSILEKYPIQSVKEIAGFFDGKQHKVAGKKMTLNELETKELIAVYKDARFHFVLVCGALGCPPITNFAYLPERVNEQMNSQTKKAMDNPNFLKVNKEDEKVGLSEIFKWYASDFGGSKKEIFNFINQYKTKKIPSTYTINYYEYDWNLNKVQEKSKDTDTESKRANAARYVVSAAIPKGTHELKLFNNLYSQSTGSEENNNGFRSTFFTSSLSYLYGLNNRFNLGFELRYRLVSNSALPSSNFDVFKGVKGRNNFSARSGITGIGPKIRWAPFKKLSHFSLQSTLLIPFEEDQEGVGNEPFIDFNNATWITQFFYDFDIGNSFSLFTEIDFSIEDIGTRKIEGGFGSDGGAFNRYSTPLTVIFSYFPTQKITLYALSNYGPQFNNDLTNGWNYDYFYQLGLGGKYQVTKKFEIEVLYTLFQSKFLLSEEDGKANTVNFGIRQSF